MAVRVRLFAAIREAAGTGETSVAPGPLPVLLDELRARYGQQFSVRLAVCSLLVDGTPTPLDATVDVADGAELALLPPVSGGAPVPPAAVGSAALGTVVGALLVAAVVAPEPAFGVTVTVLAVGVFVDFAARLSRTGVRPITVAAAVPGIGLPAASAARGMSGWTALPDFVVGGALAAFVAVLVFRRRDVTAALGRTALVGLTVGVGATGLLLLRELPDGVGWAAGTVAALSLVELVRQLAGARAGPLAVGLVTVAGALVTGGVLLLTVDPFALTSAAAVAAVALLAGATAGLLRQALDEAELAAAGAGPVPGDGPPVQGRRARPRPRAGLLTDAALPLLLGAPLAYALARLSAL